MCVCEKVLKYESDNENPYMPTPLPTPALDLVLGLFYSENGITDLFFTVLFKIIIINLMFIK